MLTLKQISDLQNMETLHSTGNTTQYQSANPDITLTTRPLAQQGWSQDSCPHSIIVLSGREDNDEFGPSAKQVTKCKYIKIINNQNVFSYMSSTFL